MNQLINSTSPDKCVLDDKKIGRSASGQDSARSPLVSVAVSPAAASSASRSTVVSRLPPQQPTPAFPGSSEGVLSLNRRASTVPPQTSSLTVPGQPPAADSGEPLRTGSCPAASHSPVSSSTTASSTTTVVPCQSTADHSVVSSAQPSKSASASATPTVAPTTSAGSHSAATSSSVNSSHGCSTTRSRRIVNFTASAFKAFRLKRLALNNPKLLRKYGITAVQLRNTSNGETLQRFEFLKRFSPSPPPPNAKHRPPPLATAFTPIPQPLVGAPASTLRAASSRGPKAQTKHAMEQRAVPQAQQIARMSQPMAPHQQSGIPQQNRMDQLMHEPGTSASCNDTPLLMNLLSSNNNNQMNSTGNGMVTQQPNQQMNPNVMRYPQQPPQQPMQPGQHSPMYPAAQQSPHYMQTNAMAGGRMMPGHPMMMPQGQQMVVPPHPVQQMAPTAAQPTETSPAKKRKRQTKKQREEEEAKKQSQQAQTGQIAQMVPGTPMQDYYMIQQGAQRVPPVNMHMPQTQYRMQYPYMHYQQASNAMMPGGAPPQYPNQHYQQQMWHPNMQQQHMSQHQSQQQADYHHHMQQQQARGQMSQQIPNTPVHYAQPQQSPAPDMKSRIPPPGYNDSMQQFAQQQQRNAQFMSPPPQHPNSSFPMQQSAQNPQQMAAMQQHQSQAAQQNHLPSRAMYDMADNVDDLVATLSSEADEYDLDSIELDPIRDGTEIGGPPSAQHMPQHPNTPAQTHYYVQSQGPQQQALPPGYPGNVQYGSPSAQQFAAQQYQMQQQQQHHHQQMYQQQMLQREQQHREQQQKNREQQDKKEREQLEEAMSRSPGAPTTPSTEPVSEAQQRSIAKTINYVLDKMTRGDWHDDEASSSSSQPAPPTTTGKRKKQGGAAKAAAAAQQTQPSTPTQPAMQQQAMIYQQTPPPAVYQQHPGTPTGFGPPSNPPAQFYYQQQRMQQMRQQPGGYPQPNNGGPMTPSYAPPVSTPDSAGGPGRATPGFYPPGQQPVYNGAYTPQRSNSLKNVLTGGSNPQTPVSVPQPMIHPMTQQTRFNENGGSGASSAAGTPSQRTSMDEPPQSLNIKEEPQCPMNSGHPQFPQQSPYAHFNGHSTPSQHFSFHSSEETKLAQLNALNSVATSSSVVSLKSQNVDSNVELCTPPSANAVSSATPTTASQQNHVDQQPQLLHEPLPPSGIKMELKEVKREHLGRDEEDQLVGNGPTNASTAPTGAK